jgi:hypothetical protein
VSFALAVQQKVGYHHDDNKEIVKPSKLVDDITIEQSRRFN